MRCHRPSATKGLIISVDADRSSCNNRYGLPIGIVGETYVIVNPNYGWRVRRYRIYRCDKRARVVKAKPVLVGVSGRVTLAQRIGEPVLIHITTGKAALGWLKVGGIHWVRFDA